MKKHFITILLALLCTTFSFAQHNYSGEVVDEISADPIPHAEVRLIYLTDSTDRFMITDDHGTFSFTDLKEGKYLVQVTHLTFASKEFVRRIPYRGKDVISLKESESILEEAVVAGTRAEETTPTTFKNISKKEIDRNNFGQDLPFVIKQTPSTVTTSDAGAGVGYTGIRLRGIDASRINVTINGFPYNDAESQGVYWVNMPDLASSVSSIQIQRGVGTSTNGSAAFGGSINIKTDKVNDKAFSRVDLGYGSYNTIRRSIQFGTGLLNNGWGFQGRYSQISSDGYVDRASADLSSFYLTAMKKTEKGQFKFNIIRGHERTYQAWFGIPQTYFEQGNKADEFISGWSAPTQENMRNSDPKKFNFYTYKNQVDNYNQDHYQGFYTRQMKLNTVLHVGVNYTRGIGYFEEYHDDAIYWQDTYLPDYGIAPVITGGDTITNSDLIRRLWLDNHFIGGIFNLSHKTSRINTRIGGGYNYYRGLHYGEVIWARYASNSEIDHRFYKNNAVKTQGNIYLKLDNEPMKNNWTYMLDLQLRRVDYRFVGPDRNNNLTDREEKYLFFNPKAGVSRILKNGVAYLSVAQSNREPVRQDFVNSTPESLPKPERLTDLEAGYRREGSNFELNANLYYMLYHNQLVPTGQLNDVGVSTRKNVDKSYRRGIELDGSYGFMENRLRAGGNLTLSQNRIVNFTEYVIAYDDQFNELPNRAKYTWNNTPIALSPEAIAGLFVEYEVIKGLKARAQVKYVSRQYLDNTGSKERSLDPYKVLDLRISYSKIFKNGTGIEVGLQANNLFGGVYVAYGYTDPYVYDGVRASDNYVYPQAPTNFLSRLAFTF